MVSNINRAFAFHDLKPEDFPFVVQLLDDATLEKLWQLVVTEPGVIEIPGFAPRAVRSRTWFSSGTVVESRPNGETGVYDLSDELRQIEANGP